MLTDFNHKRGLHHEKNSLLSSQKTVQLNPIPTPNTQVVTRKANPLKTPTDSNHVRLFPSIGLQIVDKHKIAFDHKNPFKLPENEEILLLAHENEKLVRGSLKNTVAKKHISERATATRTIRKGVIKQINDLPARSFKKPNTYALTDSDSNLQRGGYEEEHNKLNIFDEKFAQQHQRETFAFLRQDDIMENESNGGFENAMAEYGKLENGSNALLPASLGRAVVPVDEKANKMLAYLKNNANKREPVKDYVMSLRKILMAQMSIAIKKEETERLKEEFVEEEERLQEEMRMFDDCCAKFNDFLKTMKENAENAKKETEKKTNERIEKNNFYNEIKEQILQKESEIMKIEEQLDRDKEYKKFIEKLAYKYANKKRPQIFLKTQESLRNVSSPSRLAGKQRVSQFSSHTSLHQNGGEGVFMTEAENNHHSASLSSHHASMIASQILKKPYANRSVAKIKGNSFGGDSNPGHRVGSPNATISDSLESEIDDYPHEVPFESPQEMLEIFHVLEERNLFLAHNEQESEYTLEKIRKEYDFQIEKKEEMYNALKLSVNEFEKTRHALAQTLQQREKTKARLNMNEENSGENSSTMTNPKYKKLQAKIIKVYEYLNPKQVRGANSDLEMVKNIEIKMMDYLDARTYIMGLSQEIKDKFITEEKRFAMERRKEKTQHEKDLLEEEKRLLKKKNIDKLKNDATKKVFKGHNKMFRSKPPQEKPKVEIKNEKDDEFEEYFKYFT